jgi:hypothetical protein
MSFNKENFFQEGNSEEFFFSRINPLANAANAEILKIEDCGGCCDLQLNVEFETVAGVTTITVNAPTSGYDTKYFKVQITDGQGNFVTGVDTGTVSSIAIDVSTLTGSNWSVIIEIATGELDILNCDCTKKFSFAYDGGTLAIDTEALWAPALRLLKADNATIVSDNGNYSIGTFPDGGTTAPFTVYAKNVGNQVLTVSSVSFLSDVASFALAPFSGVIYPGQSIAYSGTVDTSGAAGAYGGAITINSNDPSNAAYYINILFTLA